MERLLQLIEIFILLWSVGTLANALLFGASMDDLRFSEVDEVRRRNLKLNTIEPITRKQKPFTVFSVVVVAIGIAVSFTRESNIPPTGFK